MQNTEIQEDCMSEEKWDPFRVKLPLYMQKHAAIHTQTLSKSKSLDLKWKKIDSMNVAHTWGDVRRKEQSRKQD